jgi:putative ABC transport system substrate-binding protein
MTSGKGHPHMRRREFIAVLGGAAALPLAGHAQQPERGRRVGVLMPWSENNPLTQASVTAFAHGLERFGWVDDKNIRIDYRFAADDPALFKSYAAELVQLSPDAILASGTILTLGTQQTCPSWPRKRASGAAYE